jgi:beta-lactamase superfamily II metal-dependent hydrolase
MKIGCIGWGSLIWDPRDLLIDKQWHENGPQLPVEFLRKSNDGRLTLVLCENFPLVQTLWSAMITDDIDKAVESLKVREECIGIRPIGVLRKIDPLPENAISSIIHAWLQTQELDAVIWTNLGPKFNDINGRIPTIDEAVEYLANLPESKKKLAEKYIRRTPMGVSTQYRSRFEKTLGWFPIQDSMDITFLDAGCGDAIHIRYFGNDGIFHNILIDGGTESGNIYERSLRKKLEQIIAGNEIIDLWIITHIDDDHIGGLLRLIKDDEVLSQIDLSKTKFWYNYSIWDYDTGVRDNNLKSVRQAMRLRDYLTTVSTIVSPITNALAPIDVWGARLTIISPDEEAYKNLLEKWKNEEVKIRTKESSRAKKGTNNDYKTKISEFDVSTEVLDDSEENASSIAFILEFNGKSVLFAADSNPDVLISSLMNITAGAKLKLHYMQVPHHGSRYNISNKLLQLIDCENYIISADAFNRSNLPNKVSLVKILDSNKDKEVHFYITQENDLTRNIFAVDTDQKINMHFPVKGNTGIHINL